MPFWVVGIETLINERPRGTQRENVLVSARNAEHAMKQIGDCDHLQGVKIVSVNESDIDRVLIK